MHSFPCILRLRRPVTRCPAAFSLVEVTLALGIMSFALVSLIGLLPVGLSTFHDSVDSSTGTQIAQRLLDEAQQTDFDQLIATAQKPTVRYFDDQGNELLPAKKAAAIYDTNLVVSPATTLPGAMSNQNLATVLLQIAKNPGNQVIASGSDYRWIPTASLTISSYAANVARNK